MPTNGHRPRTSWTSWCAERARYETQSSRDHPFEARGVAKRFRHAPTFGALDVLNPGETMQFVNDHDPLPLLDQLMERYGKAIAIRYQQREPRAITMTSASSALTTATMTMSR